MLPGLSILFILTTITHSMNSYTYLPDKQIEEEIPIGSLVIDLSDELKRTHTKSQSQQYTFLEDVKASTADNSYFLLDLLTGRITTKRYLDRESMCLNKHCVDSCDTYCKINLKILQIPSYSIVSLNVMVQDINDNQPQFKPNTFTQTIPENVPVGYKIPLDLAYDADTGKNSIQKYELTTVSEYFELEQDLNESHLALVVRKHLDREEIDEFNFTLVAYDGGRPTPNKGELRISLKISDINDNNPKFERPYYTFSVVESAQVDSQVGDALRAHDLDQGQNSLVKYSFVNDAQSTFALNSDTGVITLIKPLDFETEAFYSLTVEARDCGVGSLPDYATVEVYVLDVNDNQPEISVSFLGFLQRNGSTIYLPENQAPNKYIAHVSILDKDSGESGRIEWSVFVNDEPMDTSSSSSSLFTLSRLNNNSFTLNSGAKSTKLFDRETLEKINISVKAWDHGSPSSNFTYYNFTIMLSDENDNPPVFDQLSYEFRIRENNEANARVGQLRATDTDFGENALFTYAIREEDVRDRLFRIDDKGQVFVLKRLDREEVNSYVFHVVATDRGKPPLSSTVLVKVLVIDLNDNAPKISYTSVYMNKEQLPAKNTLVLSLDEDLPVKSTIVDFKCFDPDDDLNRKIEFYLSSLDKESHFSIGKDGKLRLAKALDREKVDSYELKVICEDQGEPRLSTTLSLLIYINDKNDNCPKIYNSSLATEIYLDKNNPAQSTTLLSLKFTDADHGKNGELKFVLQTHEDLFKIVEHQERLYAEQIYTIDLVLKSQKSNNSNHESLFGNLKLGRYLIRIKISDKGDPFCTINETLTILIGDSNTNKIQLLAKLNQLEKNSSHDWVNDMERDESFEVVPREQNKYESLKTSKSNKLISNQDYLLLFIIIIVIIIIAIFMSLIGTIYFYTKNTRRKQECKQLSKLQVNKSSSNAKFEHEDKKLLGAQDGEILYNDNRYSLSNKSTLSVQSNSVDSETSSTQTKETQSTFDGSTERRNGSMSTFNRFNGLSRSNSGIRSSSYSKNLSYKNSLLEASHQYKIRESRPSGLYTRISTTIDDANYLYYQHNTATLNEQQQYHYDLKSSEV